MILTAAFNLNVKSVPIQIYLIMQIMFMSKQNYISTDITIPLAINII